MPIAEPGMDDELLGVLSKGTFKAFKDLQYADCFIITVQTPIKENKLADFLVNETLDLKASGNFM